MNEKRIKFYKILGIMLLVIAIIFAVTTTLIVNAKQKDKDKIEDEIGQIPNPPVVMILK